VGFGFQVLFENVPQINFDILAYVAYFQKLKVRVSDGDALCVCASVDHPPPPGRLLNA
jgi:hypothetical protein